MHTYINYNIFSIELELVLFHTNISAPYLCSIWFASAHSVARPAAAMLSVSPTSLRNWWWAKVSRDANVKAQHPRCSKQPDHGEPCWDNFGIKVTNLREVNIKNWLNVQHSFESWLLSLEWRETGTSDYLLVYIQHIKRMSELEPWVGGEEKGKTSQSPVTLCKRGNPQKRAPCIIRLARCTTTFWWGFWVESINQFRTPPSQIET